MVENPPNFCQIGWVFSPFMRKKVENPPKCYTFECFLRIIVKNPTTNPNINYFHVRATQHFSSLLSTNILYIKACSRNCVCSPSAFLSLQDSNERTYFQTLFKETPNERLIPTRKPVEVDYLFEGG